MNAKPVEAIERMRSDWRGGLEYCSADVAAILAYIDSSSCVVWTAELTRERLDELADPSCCDWDSRSAALRALAAIAPQKRKRVVNLWRCGGELMELDPESTPPGEWKLAARNVELED